MSGALKLLLVAAIAAWSLPAEAGESRCTVPPVNKQGFRPSTTVTYSVGRSPNGAPFPPGRVKCVQRAFDAWSRANIATSLNVRFAWGPGGIVVRRDKPGGLALREKRGGGWTEPVRAADGFLQQASIWLSSDPQLVDSCDAITKVVLHELGHLHGLADTHLSRDPSVMNCVSGRNDKGHTIPLSPTTCDALQALNASTVNTALTVASGR